eukprot:g31259.t1
MGASVCHGDSFCGLGGTTQQNEMRPKSSRKDFYETSGTPKVFGGAAGADGADAVPSSVRLKDGQQILGQRIIFAATSNLGLSVEPARGAPDAGAADSLADDGVIESLAANYFLREAAELQSIQHFGGGPLVRARKRHIFKTGAVYDGQWLGNARDGFGRQTWPDGAEYVGEWKNNVVTGMGSFAHGDGDRYVGQWRRFLLAAWWVVNKFFRGKEPYQVLRSLALFLVAAKFISRLQQIIRHQGLRSYLLRCLTPYLKKLPMVRAKLDKEMKKTMSELRAKFSQDGSLPDVKLAEDLCQKVLELLPEGDAGVMLSPAMGKPFAEATRGDSSAPAVVVWLLPDPTDVDSKQTTFVRSDVKSLEDTFSAMYKLSLQEDAKPE